MLSGSTTSFRLVQFANTPCPISLIESGISTDVSFEQHSKAFFSMTVIELGIVTPVISLHPKNAYCLIVSTVSGITTPSCNPVHPANRYCGMQVMPSANAMSFKAEQPMKGPRS